MLGRHKENCIRRLNPLPELHPRRRRVCIFVLVIEGKTTDLDYVELERRRRDFKKRDRDFTIDGFLSEAANEYGDVVH